MSAPFIRTLVDEPAGTIWDVRRAAVGQGAISMVYRGLEVIPRQRRSLALEGEHS